MSRLTSFAKRLSVLVVVQLERLISTGGLTSLAIVILLAYVYLLVHRRVFA